MTRLSLADAETLAHHNPVVREALTGATVVKRSKYRAVRTEYRGNLYDSKAEAAHAAKLDVLKAAGEVVWWLRQVRIELGVPEFTTRVDFVVAYRASDGIEVRAEEVKGKPTRDWPKIARMWASYGPFPLAVVRGGKVVEVIVPGQDKS